MTPRRVCVFAQLHRPGLGDTVQRNILLSLLARAWPEASVTLVLGESLARRKPELIRHHMYADDVMICPDPRDRNPAGWARFMAELRRPGFDLCVVDPGSYDLDARHARLAKIGWRVAQPRNRPSDSDITHPVRMPPSVHRHPDLYEYTCAFADALGVPRPRAAQVIPQMPRDVEEIPELASPGPRIGVHPGGGPHWNRRWPLDRYGALCQRLVDRLGASLYLVGDDGEAAELDLLRASVRERYPTGVAHVSTQRSLNRMANLIAGLDLFVGNDSGLAHIAAAVGTPTVVIYGPSGTEHMFSRVYPRHRGVSLNYPCQSIRRPLDDVEWTHCENRCEVGYAGPAGPYPRCMVDLDLERVWTATTAQLRAYRVTGRGGVRVA
jgi:ADP-heptose:LPS heptosyltransferase